MSLTILSEQQWRALTHLLAHEYGVSEQGQVDIAGRLLAESARRLVAQVTDPTIVLLAGPGNKGAAGLAAARYLHWAGQAVRVVLACPPHALHKQAAHQYALLQALGLETWGLSLSEEAMASLPPIDWAGSGLFVDALVGSGLTGDPRGELADLIHLISTSRRPILALEGPSGLVGDEGLIYSPCVSATVTLALALPRRSLLEGWPVVGEIWLADIGVPADLYEQLGIFNLPDFAAGPLLPLGRARQLKRAD